MSKPPRAGATRPDGYFILKEAEDRARNATSKESRFQWWYDIAFTLECARGTSAKDADDVSLYLLSVADFTNQNVSKLIFNMQQSMILDASRRFTFGITVENTSMRLWFCSRATVVVSKVFDFTRVSRAALLTNKV